MAQPTYTTQYQAVPYISLSDYKAAPTGVNVGNLVAGGAASAQAVELAQTIRSASGWANTLCHQILAATVDVETRRSRISNRGEIAVHPKYWPILEVQDFEYGTQPNQLLALTDLSSVFIEEQELTVYPGPSFFTGSYGPLQFGPTYGYRAPIFLRYTYVNGYPVTRLAANSLVNAGSIQVASSLGIYGGPAGQPVANAGTPPATQLWIYDGANTELVSVASVTPGVGSGPATLTLNGATQFAHTLLGAPDSIIVTALPDDVRQAVILLTTALIKTRGDRALVHRSIESPPNEAMKTGLGGAEDAAIAMELLEPYARTF